MGYGVIHFKVPCGGPALEAISLEPYEIDDSKSEVAKLGSVSLQYSVYQGPKQALSNNRVDQVGFEMLE